jgi:hypothetical protein
VITVFKVGIATRGRKETKRQSLIKKIPLTEIHAEPREDFQNPIQESAQIKNKRKCTTHHQTTI